MSEHKPIKLLVIIGILLLIGSVTAVETHPIINPRLSYGYLHNTTAPYSTYQSTFFGQANSGLAVDYCALSGAGQIEGPYRVYVPAMAPNIFLLVPAAAKDRSSLASYSDSQNRYLYQAAGG